MRRYVGASLFAGRAEEAALLVAGVQDAARGQLRAVLVHGEPGVGKTRLVSEVCSRQQHSGTSVLWGQCVHFGATSVPYLPLVSAFEDWTMGRSNAPPEVGALLAALSGTAPPGSTRLIRIFDAAVNAVTDDGPAVLVVDDVQWADTSTLDLLAYTISSVRPRRLAVLMTYRDTELAEGHHLHGWLGDVCRLPGVSDMRLGRLSREEMETQAAALLGQPPRLALVDAVMARSDGNPYLTELLLRDVAPNAEKLADGVPAGLRTALLAAWHRLGAGARQLSRLLATGQRPLGEAELQAVAGHVGLTPDLEPALQEAIGAGVIVRDPNGDLWFHHPLLAEVLYETLPAPERRRLHAAFVAALEQPGQVDARVATHLALHAERAGRPDKAFRYARAAADHAESVGALPEAAAQRHRVAELWAAVSEEVRVDHRSEASLWCDAAEAAGRAGWVDAAVTAADAARQVMNADVDPGTAARTLRLWGLFQYTAGRLTAQPLETDRDAVRLSAASEDQEEHALCLAGLSEGETWSGEREAAHEHAEQAVAVARRSGSKRALATALSARSLADNPSAHALLDADEAQALALISGDIDTIAATCVCRANALQELHRFEEAAEQYAQGYARVLERGHVARQQLFAAYGAAALIDVGRYAHARRMLREALAFPSRGTAGLSARVAAVSLELYMGNTEAATRHLERARELAPDLETKSAQHGPTILALYHIVTGTPEQAVDVLRDNFAVHAPGELGYADWMVMWAALAMGELAMDARGRPSGHLDHARSSLRELLAAREGLGGEMFPPTDPVADAHRLVVHAELGQAFGAPDQVDRWRALAQVEHEYGEAWVMTRAMLHCARSLLEARASRTEVAVPLRRAHARSERFGFQLLLRETLELAQRSRVALDGAPGHERRGGPPGATDGLTAREREVLGHLVAGRTYSEIASALFISPKTVSVHVTHILQKTGTSSRAEAAAWAWQHGVMSHD